MLDITGMFAESLEALTSTTGHTFTTDYDSSSSNYDQSSIPIYDYPPTLNIDLDYSLSSSLPLFPPPPLPPPPPPRSFDPSHRILDFTPTPNPRFDVNYNYQDSITTNDKVNRNRLKDRNRHFKIICSGHPPSLPSPEINRNDIAFERLIELDDINIPVSYGRSNFDVVIDVGEEPDMKKFRSHSVILSKRSSYFRAALSSTWAKKQGDIYYFEKPNMTPKVFTVILRYLYFGSAKLERLDVRTLLDVLVASDELVLEDFIDEIQKHFIYLDSNLLKSNLIPIVATCFNNPSFEKLLNHLLRLIKSDPSILAKQNDIFLLQEFMFTTILEESHKLLDDWMIWSCIIKWGIGQPNMVLKDLDKWTRFDYERLHETVHSLLKFVRFSHVSRNYFVDQIVPFLTYFKEIDNETVRYYLNIPQPLTIDSKHNLFDISLNDSILVNHTHVSRVADWIDTGKVTRPVQKQKAKKCTYRFSFPFFRRRNQDIDLFLKSTTPPPPPKKPNYKFNLLYRMTRDGLSAYHDRCLKKGPTLVIVEIRLPTGGTILVGGYNPAGFDYFLDVDSSSLSQTFIFSFGNGKEFENARMSKVQTDWSRMAIKFSNVGLCFGYDDLTINFQEKSCEFNGCFSVPGAGYLLKSNIVECEIFQVLES